MASHEEDSPPPMANTTKVLSSPAQNGDTASTHVQDEKSVKAQRPYQVRPNYNKIHSRKMPLEVYPLPTFIPQNPVSYLQIVYYLLQDFISPRQSHPAKSYQGYFSATTRSVHVTDPATVRALWEMGFFGKGLLSRSEPDWLKLEKRRLGLGSSVTAAEVTGRRRQEREQFKRERARLEREALEEQRRKEARQSNGLATKIQELEHKQGLTEGDSPPGNEPTTKTEADTEPLPPSAVENPEVNGNSNHAIHQPLVRDVTPSKEDDPEGEEFEEPINQEHLQLSSEEAFYLSYSLGVLDVIDPRSNRAITDQTSLLQLFRCYSSFPPVSPSTLKPDDHFLLSYVVYHHFRSLGWTVRDGIKFAVDYLLYERGPAFNHAAFAIMIIPSYTHSYWFETPERAREVERKKAKKSWHWLHCTNRVQGQVVKTLVLVYVDVPPPFAVDEASAGDIGSLLRRYKVREFCVQRWNANRNRD
jgi:tRNA-splicing endonuclease subunit Sen2